METYQIILIIIAALIVAAGITAAVILLIRRGEKQSRADVKSIPLFENDIKTALPQTAVFDAVMKHFASPLPLGKERKKAIILGFDGARCDAIAKIEDNGKSGIIRLRNQGGLYISYAGGENKKGERQNTDTAPGWASILTGKWAKEHGAPYNGIIRPAAAAPSLLTLLPEKYPELRASFNMLWAGHWSREDKGTYCNEIDMAKEKGLALDIDHVQTDAQLHELLLKKVREDECDDFMMCIYERPDENGHGTGFGNANPKYVDSVVGCDRDAFEVISAIEARESFDKEDWMILITSDHGGTGKSHGGQSFMERTTFIACNKKI